MRSVQVQSRPISRPSSTVLHNARHRRASTRSTRCCAHTAGDNGPARLQQVLRRIDDRNSQDPRSVDVDGIPTPYELAYSRWLTGWVEQLRPNPNEVLQIVARGQHIERWQVPRGSYPEGRAAYLKWREDLKRLHADKVGGIMEEEGFGAEEVERVKSIILKKNLKDPDNQVIEDALCLVFLERQFADFGLKDDEEKMVNIIRKTWRKMGEGGRAAALELQLPEEEMRLVTKALSG